MKKSQNNYHISNYYLQQTSQSIATRLHPEFSAEIKWTTLILTAGNKLTYFSHTFSGCYILKDNFQLMMIERNVDLI